MTATTALCVLSRGLSSGEDSSNPGPRQKLDMDININNIDLKTCIIHGNTFLGITHKFFEK